MKTFTNCRRLVQTFEYLNSVVEIHQLENGTFSYKIEGKQTFETEEQAIRQAENQLEAIQEVEDHLEKRLPQDFADTDYVPSDL